MYFLGNDLLQWLVLALGAAMAIGNLLALVRPRPPGDRAEDLTRPPLGRCLIMVVIGALAAIWALASLLVN